MSSRHSKLTFLSTSGRTSSFWMRSGSTPMWRSSASKLVLPRTMFSSRFSRLNHCLILMRAWFDWQMFSQSRLGPLADLDVRISTISPLCSGAS